MIKVKLRTRPKYAYNFFSYVEGVWQEQSQFCNPSISLRQLEITLLKEYGATLVKFGLGEELRFKSKNDHLIFMLKWA